MKQWKGEFTLVEIFPFVKGICIKVLIKLFNPRLTKGKGGGRVVATPPPLTVFSRLLQNAKESDLGHIGNLFYILCGHFDGKKIGGTTLPGGVE